MKPLVGISCCSKSFGPNGLPNHAASDFCVRAVYEFADAIPVLLPAAGGERDANNLLERLDGILLTGSRTHIEPRHYGCQTVGNNSPQDPARDATTLPLIRAAVARGTPILAICRGMQEMNVALGGTLFQHLHHLPGRLNHAYAQPEDARARVAPAHSVRLAPGGLLHQALRLSEIEVNSLHQQGIDKIGDKLTVEAVAPDGTIEAVRAAGVFALGVQWHPEFDTGSNPISAAIFQAFGAALRRPGQLLAAD